jgi:uncharacterized protein (TIGR03000 family)
MRYRLKSLLPLALLALGVFGFDTSDVQAQVRHDGALTPARERPDYTMPAPLVRYRPYALPSQLLYPSPVYSTPPQEAAPRDRSAAPAESDEELPGPRSEAPPEVLPYGIPATVLPWNQVNFEGYDEPRRSPRDPPSLAPIKYALHVSTLPQMPQLPARNVVLFVSLPRGASLWIEGRKVPTGQLRTFESPPLEAGTSYRYSIRVDWLEEGQLVSQTREVPVEAGKAYAVYLQMESVTVLRKKLEMLIEANLAKLNPDEQTLARLQRYCALSPNVRLGEHGVPVKVMVKGEPIFVCHQDGVQKALSNPDQAWSAARELRARNANRAPRNPEAP